MAAPLAVCAAAALVAMSHGVCAQDNVEPTFEATGAPTRHDHVDLTGGLAYTDNAFLASSDRMSDGVGTVGVDVDYSRKGSRLNVDVRGDIDRIEYLDHSFGGSFYGNLYGTALWGRPTDLLQWLVQDTFAEGTADPLAAPTPTALETVNYFTTGPYLNLNFSANDRLTFFGQYSRTTFEKSPLDSNIYNGGALFTHGLSAVSSLVLQVSAARTEFTEEGPLATASGANGSYDTRVASLTYNARFARTQISAIAGYNTVNYGGPRSGAPLLSLQITRNISPSSSVYVRGQMSYSTLGGSLQSTLSAQSSPAAPVEVGAAAAAPFKDRSIAAGWSFARARTTLSLAATVDRQIYVDQPALSQVIGTAAFSWRRQVRPFQFVRPVNQSNYDQTDLRIEASLRRQVRPTLSVALRAYRSRDRYDTLDAEITATTVNLSMSKQLRRTRLSLYAQRTHQSASGGGQGIFVAAYDEDRVGLNVAYDLLGSHGAERP